MEHNVHDFWGAVATYSAAALALFTQNSSTLISIGGAVLLIARLVVEIPQAVRTIKTLLRGKADG